MSHRLSPIKGKAWQHCTFNVRFKASFIVDQKTGCWNWVKGKGYGWITYRGRWMPAHRAAWLHFKGPIPKGRYALHKCDNRRCVNYKQHLYLGTKKQNRQDFMRRHPCARQILLKAAYNAGKGTQKFLDHMTPLQRKRFTKRRCRIQMAKNNGHGPRWKGKNKCLL